MQSQTPSSVSPYPPQSSHSRWLALTHRTPAFHSSFFYGVKSTKIYCRPTCSARLARRANVVFYDTEDQARRDGYRPCKRCRPDDTTFVGKGQEVVTNVIALLRVRRDDSSMKGGLKELAKEAGITPSYLCRVFKKTMGVTVGEYMKEFENDASEGETESSVQLPSKADTGVMDVGTKIMMTAKTARFSEAPIEHIEGGPAEENARSDEDALDLDFDFKEWFWAEYSLSDSVYVRAIEEYSILPMTA
ncbi:putative dna repair and transcription factor protein [Botrytis cinerea BcDW1]|uniref:Putative dna repair and transcription factor protein n=1 Tax=Botryotinia fuckeliana (strain BcDW1) TaxID=1290391 RepID=M7UGB0_BOTF1|nr:putative dna repair and transcription factor protein [Botrytis cinerea BcDW1]